MNFLRATNYKRYQIYNQSHHLIGANYESNINMDMLFLSNYNETQKLV